MAKQEVLDYIDKIELPYVIYNHDKAYSIDECKSLTDLIGGKICKNLFLKTTNKSVSVLLIMNCDKKFVSKDVSKKLGCSRLSFASPAEMINELNTEPGSLGIFSLIFDSSKSIRLVIDSDVINEKYFFCHPCDNSYTLKIETKDLIEKFINKLSNKFTIIKI